MVVLAMILRLFLFFTFTRPVALCETRPMAPVTLLSAVDDDDLALVAKPPDELEEELLLPSAEAALDSFWVVSDEDGLLEAMGQPGDELTDEDPDDDDDVGGDRTCCCSC